MLLSEAVPGAVLVRRLSSFSSYNWTCYTDFTQQPHVHTMYFYLHKIILMYTVSRKKLD